ncbi:unnamed protein product [Sphacelaria rigidula]
MSFNGTTNLGMYPPSPRGVVRTCCIIFETLFIIQLRVVECSAFGNCGSSVPPCKSQLIFLSSFSLFDGPAVDLHASAGNNEELLNHRVPKKQTGQTKMAPYTIRVTMVLLETKKHGSDEIMIRLEIS